MTEAKIYQNIDSKKRVTVLQVINSYHTDLIQVKYVRSGHRCWYDVSHFNKKFICVTE